ncbi:hypothetical protein BKA61DRAFT_283901 [Leptodontidium sp. MPI-SDFR-AT-0119]|nr:hypothetical protein BKA61DRAFT_283901 [Leptodontidium sp. MPI-SDFR-AT-0119]
MSCLGLSKVYVWSFDHARYRERRLVGKPTHVSGVPLIHAYTPLGVTPWTNFLRGIYWVVTSNKFYISPIQHQSTTSSRQESQSGRNIMSSVLMDLSNLSDMSEEEQIDGAPPNHRSTQGADVDMDVDSYADSDYNSNDSDSDLDGNTTVAIYDIIWSVRHDDKFGNLARGDFEERLKIRRVSNGGADGTLDTYHTFSFRHGKYLVKGYCDLSDGSIPVHGPFGNFSMQWMNGAMVTDFVEGDWEADDQGNGYFHLGFMNNLVDDHGAAILAFRFLLGQAGESKPNTQVYGWAKLRTGLDGCPPAEISEAEKQRLDGNDSGDMEPDLLGRLRSLFSAADR